MPRKSQIRVDSLGRIMVYILGHRPDEFGLVPGEEGFVPVKEFLLAIHEEPGWGYVRQGHINEVLVGKDRSLFHVEGSSIRALDRRWRLDLVNPAPTLPGLLFVPIRRRAHSHALEKGVRAGEGTRLVLFPDESMALRVGKRRDQKPVVLEVNTDRARREGVCFYAFGEVFLAGEIPAACITGPPLPKETVKVREPEKEKRPGDLPLPHFEAGTFTLDLSRDPAPHRRGKGKKGKGWKEEARNLRRRKGH